MNRKIRDLFLWLQFGSVGGYVVILLAIAFVAFFWIFFGAAFDVLNDINNQQVEMHIPISGERIDAQMWILQAHKAVPVFFFILLLVWGILTALRERSEVG